FLSQTTASLHIYTLSLHDALPICQFEAVLLTDVDRLSRDLANLAVVKRDLESKGLNLVFQKLPTDGSPLSNFMVNILGSFAEFEDRKSTRLNSSHDQTSYAVFCLK